MRAADARTSAVHPESVHARWSSHDFAVFSAALTIAYLAYYLAQANSLLSELVMVNVLALTGHAAAIVLARARKQLASALTALTTSTVQIVLVVQLLGSDSGLHLYLVSGGVLVFVVFTERQAPWRWFFIAVAAVTFVWCQTIAAPAKALPFPDGAFSTMFSLNAVATALLVFALSGLSYHRANQARAEAARAAARAEYLANTDSLTGLVNRRPIIEMLDSQGLLGGYVVAIADLDHFKALNDTHGHQCGDAVLVEVAGLLRGRLRGSDAVGRWGGEEFIVVLPGTTAEDGLALADELRDLIEKFEVPCHGHTHRVTVSIGVADGASDAHSHGVVKRADDALYDAKVAGRNAVRLRPKVESPEPATPKEPRVSRTARALRRPGG